MNETEQSKTTLQTGALQDKSPQGKSLPANSFPKDVNRLPKLLKEIAKSGKAADTEPLVRTLADRDVCVSLVRGPVLNRNRALFEFCHTSLGATNPKSISAIPTPNKNWWMLCHSVGPNKSDRPIVPSSFSLARALVIHNQIPADWICALVLPSWNECSITYFSGEGIYGSVHSSLSYSQDNTGAENAYSRILAEIVALTHSTSAPDSLAAKKSLSAIYLSHDLNTRDPKPPLDECAEALFDRFEIPVEIVSDRLRLKRADGMRELEAGIVIE